MATDDVIEIVRPEAVPRRIRAVLFDWDGTLSLLREGWPAVMTAQMLGVLREVSSDAGAENLSATVESTVVGLNGRPTIVQMQALAAQGIARGGRAKEPAAYLADYQALLFDLIGERYAAIESGLNPAHTWVVPGAREFLGQLRSRGLPIILLSGTTRQHVLREANLLGMAGLFDELLAPPDDDPEFSKRQVIKQLLVEHGIAGFELLGFGDGVIETQDVRHVGGVAVAVASAEPPLRGVNAVKREYLIHAGADVVIADYDGFPQWLPRLVVEE